MRLELSHWPLAVTRLEGRATIEHLDAYFHDFEARVMTREEPFASIFDATGLTHLPDAATRARAATWARAHQSFGIRYNCGLAIVAPSPLARAVMKALHWVVPPRVPTSFEPDFSAALRFTSRRLVASDVDIAPIANWIARECG